MPLLKAFFIVAVLLALNLQIFRLRAIFFALLCVITMFYFSPIFSRNELILFFVLYVMIYAPTSRFYISQVFSASLTHQLRALLA
jgi:hypothetical protein